ncbi:MAG: hypothetical protein AB1510_07255 [Bacillota bacterium]
MQLIHTPCGLFMYGPARKVFHNLRLICANNPGAFKEYLRARIH